MSEKLTIADSKKAFHKAFPYVIPPIYRRVADELLVELHLLSHQRDFKPGKIFAVGLQNVFKSFTRGYRPEKHLPALFKAICESNGFDPEKLISDSSNTLELVKDKKAKEIEDWLKNSGEGAPGKLKEEIKTFLKGHNYYNRLISIGIYTLLSEASATETEKGEIINTIKETCNSYGFSANRVERDLKQYSSNIEKISQALELMKEAVQRERTKNKPMEKTVSVEMKEVTN